MIEVSVGAHMIIEPSTCLNHACKKKKIKWLIKVRTDMLVSATKRRN